MPLTGALNADFDDFVNEANKASAALGVMEAEAKKTGTTLAKTGSTMDGFGKDASLSQLSTGLKAVDATANAMGVSMAKPIAAIEELGKVSGLTYAQLGLLGSAGVAAGVAITGIELGRWIGDVTGMVDTMGRVQERFLGWGDAADRVANKQAILDLAFQRTGQAFTDVNLAIAASNKWIEDHQKKITTAADRQAHWDGILRQFGGSLPRMMEALENHTATVKQLGIEYGIDTDALTYYIAKKKEETAVNTAATKEAEAAAAAQQKLREAMFGTDSITQAQQYQAALGSTANLTRMTQEEQTKLNTVLGEAIASYKRAGEVAPQAMRDLYNATVSIGPVVTGLGAEFANIGTKFTVTADRIITDTQRMKTEAAAYEAQTQSMVDEAQRIAPPIAAAEQETQQLTVAFQQAAGAIRMTAAEAAQAGQELEQAYRNAGIFVGMQGGAMSGYQQGRRLDAGREITGAGQAWGNTLNVNVNNADAQGIASKLVTEMRSQGVRF